MTAIVGPRGLSFASSHRKYHFFFLFYRRPEREFGTTFLLDISPILHEECREKERERDVCNHNEATKADGSGADTVRGATEIQGKRRSKVLRINNRVRLFSWSSFTFFKKIHTHSHEMRYVFSVIYDVDQQ